MLLPNAAECRALAGVEDLEAAALALASVDGAPRRTVAVKDGSAGGLAVGPDGALARAAAIAVDAVDTTGAGDSFNAGFLAAWLDGRPLDAALRLAVACGSLSTRTAGGTDGQPTRAEAEAAVRCRHAADVTTSTVPDAPIRRVVGVALNAAVDKTVSVDRLVAGGHPSAGRPVGRRGRQGRQRRPRGGAPRARRRDGRGPRWARRGVVPRGARRPVDRPARGLGRGRDADLPVGARRGDRRADRVLRGRRPAGRGRLGRGRGRPPRGDRRRRRGDGRRAGRAACRPGPRWTATRGSSGSRRRPARAPSSTATGPRWPPRSTSDRGSSRSTPPRPRPSPGRARGRRSEPQRPPRSCVTEARRSRSSPAACTARASRRRTAPGRSAACPLPIVDPGRSAAATRSWPGSSPGSRAAWPAPDALALAGAAGAANARIPGQGELEPADVERTLRVCAVTSR